MKNNNLHYELKEIEISNLIIWMENPRFGHLLTFYNEPNLVDDESTINFLIKQESEITDNENKKLEEFKELIESLLENGYIEDEPILVKKWHDSEKYYLLDGNRRISAVKILNYLKNNQQNWIKWFEDQFTQNYFYWIKSKINDFSCEKIWCRVFVSNTPDYVIKKYVYKTDIVNKFGKKYWSRINRLSYVYKEYENLKQEGIDNNEIVKLLAKLFDKSKKTVLKDLNSAKWVFFCLNKTNFSKDEYNKWDISPLELAKNNIIDPCSGFKLGEILDIKLENEIFYIGENTKINHIKIENLCTFLCECLKKKFYTTRGWKPEYYAELINFLYQNTNKNINPIITIPLKDLDRILHETDNQNFNEEDKKNGNVVHKKYIEISKIYETIRKKVEKLNDKKNIFLEKVEHKLESEENNCAVHFCSFISSLYHEIINLRFINNSSAENFPYAFFSLLFRNTFIMIINMIFIDCTANEYFINKLKEEKLADVEIINRGDIKIKFIDLLQQTDWRSPSQFSSFEKITNSLFYRGRWNIHGFFTNDNTNEKEEKIINLFVDSFSDLFNLVYKQISEKLGINQNKIDRNNFVFFTNFLCKRESYDFLCRNIHNDIYIVTTYSPSLTKAYRDIFCKIKKFFSDFSLFINHLID